MKKFINLSAFFFSSVILCMAIFFASCGSSSKTTTGTDNVSIINAIDKNEWVFTADYMMPSSGKSQAVNGVYNVTGTAGKMVVALPYFGNSYSTSTALSNKSPLDFTSTDFTLDKKVVKEGKWSVVVKPKDYNEVQSMNYTFFDNGSATLDVTLTNKSSISFKGTLTAKK